jgi:SAM-dependent methyltransferase
MIAPVEGYVTDVPYVPIVHQHLAPAWLDHVAVISGLLPPARKDEFAWCDLGCGLGTTAVMLAATHPYGLFHGIDAMPEHTDRGRRFAAEGEVANVIFHTADFVTAGRLELPKFDYIVAHGVYSWVGPQVRSDVRSFIESRLKPGGLVYLGYYAMPGRAADLPFQRLVRAIDETCKGDSTQRVNRRTKNYRSASWVEGACIGGKPHAFKAQTGGVSRCRELSRSRIYGSALGSALRY